MVCTDYLNLNVVRDNRLCVRLNTRHWCSCWHYCAMPQVWYSKKEKLFPKKHLITRQLKSLKFIIYLLVGHVEISSSYVLHGYEWASTFTLQDYPIFLGHCFMWPLPITCRLLVLRVTQLFHFVWFPVSWQLITYNSPAILHSWYFIFATHFIWRLTLHTCKFNRNGAENIFLRELRKWITNSTHGLVKG